MNIEIQKFPALLLLKFPAGNFVIYPDNLRIKYFVERTSVFCYTKMGGVG